MALILKPQTGGTKQTLAQASTVKAQQIIAAATAAYGPDVDGPETFDEETPSALALVASNKTADTPAKTAQSPSSPSKAKPLSFLKKGKEAQQMMEEEKVHADIAKEQRNQLWRFRIDEKHCGEDYKITFLDGNIDTDGLLDCPMWREHNIHLSGKWTPVPCTSATEPCLICEGSDNPAMMAAFTIIDHTPYTIKKGDKAGQVIPMTKKLFVCKRQTLATLQKHATKYKGLAGVTLEVSRSTAKTASCGDTFMFIGKDTLQALKNAFGEELVTPADFGHEITYYDRATMLSLGIKASGKTIGGHAASVGSLDNDVDF